MQNHHSCATKHLSVCLPALQTSLTQYKPVPITAPALPCHQAVFASLEEPPRSSFGTDSFALTAACAVPECQLSLLAIPSSHA